MKKTAIYLVLILLALTGCKKYEEGPAISLRSKEARLCQEWKTDNYLQNGESYIFFVEQYWNINKDGTMEMTTIYDENDEATDTYSWRWVDNKESIEIQFSVEKKNHAFYPLKSTKTNEWIKLNIKKLKNENLVFETEIEGADYRIELIKK